MTGAGDTPEPPVRPSRINLPDGPEVWCTSVPAATAMWREMMPPGTYDRAAATVAEGGTVLDIGASIGLMSVLCALRTPGLRVIAAEPAPEPFACLRLNLALYVGTWEAECVAVAARSGELPFTYYPQAPGNSGLFADPEADAEVTRRYLTNTGLSPEEAAELTEGLHQGVEHRVRVVTVSDLIRRHRVARVDLLKVDVERAELDVLRGVADEDWPRVGRVVAEVHDEDGRLARCERLLRSKGFEVTVTQDPLLAGTVLYGIEAGRPT
ncbi:FkbM family methyltransferase [Streptomyces sasae]|uniref:FkbM family methyltransferase n=1 Tax=Streptomyces sasae TaxID=1266772 RepID=UPI00292E2B30|nr:FkbM family methyltransferase [Streptomyces sasae]